jgi:5'-3' exonuclease
MGIPKFNSWFHAAHAPAYVRLDGPDGPGTSGADHVYVDMNSVLHSALRQVRAT